MEVFSVTELYIKKPIGVFPKSAFKSISKTLPSFSELENLCKIEILICHFHYFYFWFESIFGNSDFIVK